MVHTVRLPETCAFCAIVASPSLVEVVAEWEETIAFLPRLDERTGLRGCVEGHILVVSKKHVPDFTENRGVAGLTAMRASELAHRRGGQWNLITSAGLSATQTVFHLHMHLVPRLAGDGLLLPWSVR